MRTLDLLKAFLVDLAYGLVFALEVLDTLNEWICDLQLFILSFIIVALLRIVKRGLELPYEFDELSRLLGQVVFLTAQECK